MDILSDLPSTTEDIAASDQNEADLPNRLTEAVNEIADTIVTEIMERVRVVADLDLLASSQATLSNELKSLVLEGLEEACVIACTPDDEVGGMEYVNHSLEELNNERQTE